MVAVVWLKVRSGNGSSGVRTMRWLVALECEMARMLRRGMWQPMQLSLGVVAWRKARGAVQLAVVWQERHAELK